MKLNILIIEDDPMVAHIHQHYLNELGSFHVVKVIDNGLEAFEYIKTHEAEIDLVILDVQMPKLTGLEMLKLLREEGSDISVIPITAVNDNKTISEFLNLGVVDYLVKPFSQDRFNQAVSRCELKFKMFAEQGELSQQEIDRMFQSTTRTELPKGLQESTLQFIKKELLKHVGDLLDAEEISRITNLSKVSVRKYLDHLSQQGAIEKRMDYGTVGRPKYKYLIK